jgi:hypothetical protein
MDHQRPANKGTPLLRTLDRNPLKLSVVRLGVSFIETFPLASLLHSITDESHTPSHILCHPFILRNSCQLSTLFTSRFYPLFAFRFNSEIHIFQHPSRIQHQLPFIQILTMCTKKLAKSFTHFPFLFIFLS